MVRGVIIIVLSLVGIFIHPFPPGIIDFIFRLLIFSGIIYLIYSDQKSSLKDQQISNNNERKSKVYYDDELNRLYAGVI